MELAILQSFDWCLEYIECPPLSSLLHTAGLKTEELSEDQLYSLNEAVLAVYQEADVIEKRFDDPYVWAMACLQASGVASNDCLKQVEEHFFGVKKGSKKQKKLVRDAEEEIAAILSVVKESKKVKSEW